MWWASERVFHPSPKIIWKPMLWTKAILGSLGRGSRGEKLGPFCRFQWRHSVTSTYDYFLFPSSVIHYVVVVAFSNASKLAVIIPSGPSAERTYWREWVPFPAGERYFQSIKILQNSKHGAQGSFWHSLRLCWEEISQLDWTVFHLRVLKICS